MQKRNGRERVGKSAGSAGRGTLLTFSAALAALTALMFSGMHEPPHAEAQFSLPKFQKKIELPAARIIDQFNDPAFPQVDPTIQTISPNSLRPSERPVPAERRLSLDGFQGLLNRIIQVGPRPNQPAKVLFYEDQMINAQAFGDGSILISTGMLDHLLKQVETEANRPAAEDFLAFTLAHEYGHILLRHPQERSQSESTLANVQKAFNVIGTVYLIGRAATISPTASQTVQQRQAYQALGTMVAASLVGGFLEGEAKRMVLPGFARSTERDADMLAVDLLERLRKSNAAAQTRLKAVEPVNGVDQLKLISGENKTIVTKTATLVRDAANTTKTTATTLATLAPAMMLQKGSTDIGNELKTLAVLSAADFVLRKLDERRRMTDVHLHDSAERRGRLVRAYVGEFYADTVPSPSQVGDAAPTPATAPAGPAAPGQVDWTKMRGERAASLAKSRAIEALAKGDIPAARVAIDEVLASSMQRSPDVQRLAGAVATGEGQHAKAITHYRAAITGGAREEGTYNALIQAHLTLNQRQPALRVIDEAGLALADTARYLPMKVTIFRLEENKTAMEAALLECRALQGRPDLIQACNNAALSPEEAAAAAALATAAPAGGAQPASAADPAATAMQEQLNKAGKGIAKAFSGLGRRKSEQGASDDDDEDAGEEAEAAPAVPKKK